MLVLRRRVGETIAIGGGIEVEVVEISRTRVKLGVTAPRNVTVVRKETVTVAAENRKALELVSRGAHAFSEALRLLGATLLRRPLEVSVAMPISNSEDITGIPNESGEPGPGMMTGIYQAKDAKNVVINPNQRSLADRTE